jgi:DNA-binding transcriptional regulator YiaG
MTYSSAETVQSEWLTNTDLAARYQVPVETIRKWRSDGTGPPGQRFGRHVRYRRSMVERWENSRGDAPDAA